MSRLEMEAGGKVLVEEKDAVTTVLVARAKFLMERRDLVRRFVPAHRELTDWIGKNPEEAQHLARSELRTTFRADLPAELVARAWTRLTITADTSPAAFERFVASAKKVGFLRRHARPVALDRDAMMAMRSSCRHQPPVRARAAKLVVRASPSGIRTSRATCTRSTTSRSRWRRASSSAWSGRAAAASPRCSTSWPA